MQEGSPAHAMTCDVEDYFQVSAFNDHVRRSDWENFECRIPRNIDLILNRFTDSGTKATFFTLGWAAQKYPEVVRRITDAGHEIASHGMQHTRVWQQSRDEFHEDVVSTRKLLEDVSGQPVIGYRAASWSIDGRTPWAYDVLAEAGYRYSSSIYPIAHDHFGDPDAPIAPHTVGNAGLLEIPASTARVFGRNIPAAGGGYFRLFPFWFSKLLIHRIEADERPYVFYFHPWEIDPDQPRIKGIPTKSRFRHYVNLGKFESRLSRMLQEFDWDRMDRIFMDSI
jgi:polysaccharide deacetylase family protein (PEP-CTERM system associated)